MRPGTPADAEGLLALIGRIFPYRVTALTDLRRELEQRIAEKHNCSFAIEAGDRLIGWGAAILSTWSPDPGEYHVQIVVHPDHRRQGIGTTLAQAVDEHLAQQDVGRILSSATESGVDFALQQGYRGTDVMHYAGLDPRLAPEPLEVPAGIELTTLAEVDLETAYAAFLPTVGDVPGDQDFSQFPLESYEKEIWNSAGFNRQLSTAAVAEGKIVCFTNVITADDRLWTDMTGTLAQYRGRGLAKVVKTAGLRAAAAAGITNAYTVNHEVNAPMLAINNWLGYRRIASHTGMVRLS